MIFNLITCIPLSINPCRREIYLTFFKRKSNPLEHFLLTAFLLGMSAVLATAYPNITSAFGILGSFMAVPIVIYYPGMLYLKLSTEPWYYPKKLCLIIVLILLCTLGFGAGVVTLL